jgi:hypothetical protein
LSTVVDDGVDLIEVLGGAGADHAEVSSAKDEDCYAGDSRLRQGSSEMRFAQGANAASATIRLARRWGTRREQLRLMKSSPSLWNRLTTP